MNVIIGWILLVLTIISLIMIYFIIFKKKVYNKDFFGLIVDSWEIVAFAIALILVSLVLILKK